MFVKSSLKSSMDMLASLAFEVFLCILFASYLDSLSVFLFSLYCIAFDILFRKTSFVPCVSNLPFVSSVFNLFLVRSFMDSLSEEYQILCNF